MELENEENHRQAKRQIEREKGRREVVADMSEDLSEGEKGENINDVSVHIIRIPFGPKDIYVPKELLWPHVPEFVDGALGHVIQMSKVLAARLSGALNVPMPFTGHSLGRDKLEQLLRQGRLTKHEINATYKIMRRIEGEENSLDASDIVISRTRQEIEQWRLYDGFDPVLEKILRARIRRNVSCYGRFMPRMVATYQPSFVILSSRNKLI
ncbi:unnamed protein product [Lactuca virosa]|uniref:Sucrose synthase n=1 Tax=Lactuca virosa TaxID=75947 RepID=A0AAU9N5H3_9ASTR|nr:unnamed protein product [Lactuca virosa]